ncbi:hypothetical protein SKAU_G00129250 [Synaphobranchus kaupii]|uniref:Ubiquitin-like domain-containing protein n=1 Tax=Synaphobranchus kaupii TaxID=118154 RepID=A0A9Q1FQH4_SYNKA|nr:hypothetical protein SKAU_G00129250 [Synaphobranchus kaupii]
MAAECGIEDIVVKTEDSIEKQSGNVGEGGSPAVCSQESRTDDEFPLSNGGETFEGKEMVDLKIIWNKNKYDLKISLDGTGANLKERINSLTGLPPSMQKVMYKGLLPEDKTLREIKVTNEPLCGQKQHRKVLDKGKPEDIMPSLKGIKERLPTVPLSGMYNKSGGKVRLTFKLEQDQLWIGTKERTEKIPMGSIKNVVTEPIEGHEGYYMMAFQLGPTEASQYWVYWVPAQYVDAIKDTVLGKWQYF